MIKLMKHLLCNTIKNQQISQSTKTTGFQTTLTVTYKRSTDCFLGSQKRFLCFDHTTNVPCSCDMILTPRTSENEVNSGNRLPFFNQFGTTTSVISPHWWWPQFLPAVLFQWQGFGHDYYEANQSVTKILIFLRFWTTNTIWTSAIPKYSKKMNNTCRYSEYIQTGALLATTKADMSLSEFSWVPWLLKLKKTSISIHFQQHQHFWPANHGFLLPPSLCHQKIPASFDLITSSPEVSTSGPGPAYRLEAFQEAQRKSAQPPDLPELLRETKAT